MGRLITALAAGFMLAATLSSNAFAAGSVRGEGYFSNAEVVDQDGRRLKFFDDVLKDQIVVINFVFTHCGDICPLSTARLNVAKEKLAAMGRTDIRFISMTVDPERDTPARMKAMAEAYNTGSNWLMLTGAPEVISTINSKLGDRSTRPSDHRMEVVLGNAATGEWQRNSPLGELDRLVFDILQMDPKWRETKRSVAHDNDANIALALSEQPGEALFRKMCAACHTIGVGNRVGPDLRDVTERRPHEWLKAFIMNPDQMLKSGDATAVALNHAFPDATMPRLGLKGNDTEDLIAYLKAASEKLTDGKEQADADIHIHEDGSAHQH